MAPFLFLCTAWAGEAAYYHPSEVAAKSTLFAEASEASHPAYMKAQGSLERWDAALLHLELGADLTGDADTKAQAAKLRKQFTIQRMQIQNHYDVLVGSYNEAFTAALDRALPTVAAGRAAVECTERGANMFSAPTAECKGENLNKALAAAMDQDAGLKDALTQINAMAWPSVSLQPQQSTPIALTGTGNWISLSDLALGIRGEQLKRLRETRDAQLELITEGLEAGDPDTIAEGKAIDQSYRDAIREEGKLLMEAAELAINKKASKDPKLADIGFCLQPQDLGSCSGEEESQRALDAIRENRKARKLLGL